VKTEGQVIQRLKQVQFRCVKKELSQLLSVRPDNCSKHKVLNAPAGKVGVCTLDSSLCDLSRCKGCKEYEPKYDKDQLKESLSHFFDTRGPKEVAPRFPVVSALMWVLSDEDPFPLEESPQLEVGGVQVSVETEEQAQGLRDYIEAVEQQLSDLRTQVKTLSSIEPAPQRKGFWSRWFS